MKKTFYLSIMFGLSLLVLAGSVQAQKKFVNKASSWAEKGERLDTALKLISAAEMDESTKDWAKTYYAKGLIYEALSNSSNPEFQTICEYPLIKAFESYKKTYNMEGSKIYQGLIDVKLLTIVNRFINKAVTSYQDEDYDDAYKYFKVALEVKGMPIFAGEIDTVIIFNTAVIAQRLEKYDEAISFYKKAIEYKYGEGDTYALLAESYKAKKYTETYLKTLKLGFEKYPSNQSLLGGIINYYLLESDNSAEAFKYLALAREGDPGNPQFYSAEAHLYDKVGEKAKAKETYKKAIALDENFFEAYYNLGVIYFNEGVELTDKANEIVDNKKYEAAKKIADDKFIESLPFIEKAHELQPEDQGIIATLKTLYYRLKMTEKYEALIKKTE